MSYLLFEYLTDVFSSLFDVQVSKYATSYKNKQAFTRQNSDDRETDKHPNSPNQLVKSPSRTPSKKRKLATKPVKKRFVRGPTYMPKVVK